METEKLFKEYRNWKKDMGLLEFELSRFEGVPYEDVIRSMCLSQPQGERVQGGGTSDKTGNAAVKYRQVKERLDDDWFDYLLWPLLVTSSTQMRTLTNGLALFVGENTIQYGAAFAGAFISIIPMLLVYLFGQKYFVEGTATTGLK